MSRVAVVGGGVTGLAAARGLARSGHTVTLLEQSARWGGKLAATVLDPLALDGGAESMLARRPEAIGLVEELGLGAERVHPTSASPRLLVDGALHRMPPSLQGIPVDVDALAGLLTPAGLARAAEEPDRPAPGLTGDVGVGAYVAERFGDEVTDRLLEPLLGGVYAGRSRDLSFAAVMPDLYARARVGGSLLGHARALLRPPTGAPVFAGLRGGVHRLADALTADLDRRGVVRRPDACVRGVERRPGAGWRLLVGPATGPESLDVDAVLLAAPAPATGRLTAGLLASADALTALPYASVAVLTLAVRGLDADASGVLVPPGELPTVKALTYSSAKWAWVGEHARQTWGAGTAVVRASVGRAGESSTLQVDDATLLRRTVAELASVPGWADAQVLASTVTRWGGGLPQYGLGHRDLVTGVRAEAADRPGLAVAGAWTDGVGIAACLASATAAITKINSDLEHGHHDDDDADPHDTRKVSRT